MGCHSLLRGIFPTQGLNPGLPHCRQILYHLSYQGSPYASLGLSKHQRRRFGWSLYRLWTAPSPPSSPKMSQREAPTFSPVCVSLSCLLTHSCIQIGLLDDYTIYCVGKKTHLDFSITSYGKTWTNFGANPLNLMRACQLVTSSLWPTWKGLQRNQSLSKEVWPGGEETHNHFMSFLSGICFIQPLWVGG